MDKRSLIERIIDAYTPEMERHASRLAKKIRGVKATTEIPMKDLEATTNISKIKTGQKVGDIKRSATMDPVKVSVFKKVRSSPDQDLAMGGSMADLVANSMTGMTIPPRRRGENSKIMMNQSALEMGRDMSSMMGLKKPKKGYGGVARHIMGHELVHSQSPRLTRKTAIQSAERRGKAADKMGLLAGTQYFADPEETRAYTAVSTRDLMKDFRRKKYGRDKAKKLITMPALAAHGVETDAGKLSHLGISIAGHRASYEQLRDLRGAAKKINNQSFGMQKLFGLDPDPDVAVPGRVAKRGRKAYKQFHKGLYQNFERAYPQKARTTKKGSLTMAPKKPSLPEGIRRDILNVLNEARKPTKFRIRQRMQASRPESAEKAHEKMHLSAPKYREKLPMIPVRKDTDTVPRRIRRTPNKQTPNDLRPLSQRIVPKALTGEWNASSGDQAASLFDFQRVMSTPAVTKAELKTKIDQVARRKGKSMKVNFGGVGRSLGTNESRRELINGIIEASIDHVDKNLYRSALKAQREVNRDKPKLSHFTKKGRAKHARKDVTFREVGDKGKGPVHSAKPMRMPAFISKGLGLGGAAAPLTKDALGRRRGFVALPKSEDPKKLSFGEKQAATHEMVHLADTRGMDQAQKSASAAVKKKGTMGVLQDRLDLMIGVAKRDPKAMKTYTTDPREAHAYSAVAGTLGVRHQKKKGRTRADQMSDLRQGNIGYLNNDAFETGHTIANMARSHGGKKGKKVYRKFHKEVYKGIERAYPEHKPTYSTGIARATHKPKLPEEDRSLLAQAIMEASGYRPPEGLKPVKDKYWYDTESSGKPYQRDLARGINNELFNALQRHGNDPILRQLDTPRQRRSTVRSVGRNLRNDFNRGFSKREKLLYHQARQAGYKPDPAEIRQQAGLMMPGSQVGKYPGWEKDEYDFVTPGSDRLKSSSATYGFDPSDAKGLLRDAAQTRLRGQRLKRRMQKRGLQYTPAKKGRVTRRMNQNRAGRRGRLPESLDEAKKINWGNVGHVVAGAIQGGMAGATAGTIGGSMAGSSGEVKRNHAAMKEMQRRMNAPKNDDPRITGAAKKRVNLIDPKPFVDSRRVKAPEGVAMIQTHGQLDKWSQSKENIHQKHMGKDITPDVVGYLKTEFLPDKGKSGNAVYMAAQSKRGTPAVLAPKSVDHRVTRHEIGHAIDLKGKTIDDLQVHNDAPVPMMGSWKNRTYQDEVNAWDKADVPSYDPMRKLALTSYETSNKSTQKGKRGAAGGAIVGGVMGALAGAARAHKQNPIFKEEVIEGILWEMAKKEKTSRISKAILTVRKKSEQLIRKMEGKDKRGQK